MLSLVHVGLSVVCLIIGAVIFFRPKADEWHRRMGKIYALSMIGLNVAGLCIYHLTGHFNLFHFTAVLNLALVLIGWFQVILRRRLRRWLYRHYVYMCWSYTALVAAAINESFVRISPLKELVRQAGNWVIIATQVILILVAAVVIKRNQGRMVG